MSASKFCFYDDKNFKHLSLAIVHIHRLIYDYGNYTLDISGPLMINTQKLTALAFAFFDGYRSKQRAKLRRPDEDEEHSALNEDQEKQKILDIPTPIEFLSYIFYFHGICVGPLCFFKDYCDFIEGRNLLVIPTSKLAATTTEIPDEKQLSKIEQPSNFWPVLTKLGQCVIWGYILTVYTPYYPIEYNLSQKMVNSPFYKRLCFLLFSTFFARAK
jgi:lysophospholipid acyltransferase 1/2